jgi:hypothetical protein
MKKVFQLLLLILLFACNSDKKVESSQTEEVAATSNISALEFINAYNANKAQYDKEYIDKIITISGPVANAIETEGGFNIEIAGADNSQTISCGFVKGALKTEDLPAEGEQVTITGKCTGYSEEELMGLKTVYLVQCLINK